MQLLVLGPQCLGAHFWNASKLWSVEGWDASKFWKIKHFESFFRKSVQNCYLVLKVLFQSCLESLQSHLAGLCRFDWLMFYLCFPPSLLLSFDFNCLIYDFLICPCFSFCKRTRILLAISRLYYQQNQYVAH